MTTIKQYGLQEYKQCAGMGCKNRAIHQLEVLYIKKLGWFCSECKISLVASELVKEMKDSVEQQ
jgi:hypothetical protein